MFEVIALGYIWILHDYMYELQVFVLYYGLLVMIEAIEAQIQREAETKIVPNEKLSVI